MSGVVRGNLGDNGDRIDDLYGSLVARHLSDNGTVVTLYHKDRYLIEVTFDHNVSVLEKYSRYDRTDLSEKEVTRLLKMNTGRAKWVRDEKSQEGWFERSDHMAKAKAAQGELTVKIATLKSEKGKTRE
ncbi:MAG TPA: hypothetical protein VGG94_06655 [Chthoniobacterales bacterium]